MSEKPAGQDDVGSIVARLTDSGLDARERGRLLAGLARLLTARLRATGPQGGPRGTWLSELVADVAMRLPVRDLLTLRSHHGGLSGDELAEALVTHAARATAGIGAAGGALAAVQLAAPPTLLAAPVQLAAETLAVVAVELKLVAELHVVYGQAPVGSRSQLAAAYLLSWAGRRGISSAGDGPSLAGVLGVAGRTQLRRRVVRRLGRNAATLAPFLAGAVAGAELNRRETRRLGDKLTADLRRSR